MEDDENPQTSPTQKSHQPPPLAAAGWFLVIIAVYFIGLFLFSFLYGIAHSASNAGLEPKQVQAAFVEYLRSPSGMAGVYVVQFMLLAPLLINISNFPKQAWWQTLAIHPVKKEVWLKWIVILGIFELASTLAEMLATLPPDPFMLTLNGCRNLWISLTIVLLAPIIEEGIFRGYLFKAWRSSWLGASGTIAITSLLFSVVHYSQYNWLVLCELGTFAILLGIAREKTGSLLVPIVLHSLNNLLSVIFVIYLGMLS